MKPGFLLFAVVPLLSLGDTRPLKNYVNLDAGVYGNNLAQRLSAPTGYASYVSTLAAITRLRVGLSLGKKWYFTPGVSFVFPWRAGEDGSTKVFTTHLGLPIAVPVASWLRFNIGPGIQWLYFSSSGQVIEQRNGTGSSTFYLPSRSSNSFLFLSNAGFEFLLSSRFSFNLDLMVLNIMSSNRRRFNGMVTLGYRL